MSLPAEYAEETITLDQFRLLHALYKTEPDLQPAHARFPLVTCGTTTRSTTTTPLTSRKTARRRSSSASRRIAGYQAFYEHLPLRSVARPDRRGQAELYRRSLGTMAEFDVVDTRQYRNDHPCGDGEHARCAASFDPGQTMLGARQERGSSRPAPRRPGGTCSPSRSWSPSSTTISARRRSSGRIRGTAIRWRGNGCSKG